MKRYLGVVFAVLWFAGCGTGSKVQVVSPTLPEDELRDRVRELPVVKPGVELKEEKATDKREGVKGEWVHVREAATAAGGNTAEEPLSKEHREEALINLLEKKGIITKKELAEEMRILKEKVAK